MGCERISERRHTLTNEYETTQRSIFIAFSSLLDDLACLMARLMSLFDSIESPTARGPSGRPYRVFSKPTKEDISIS